MYVHTHDDVGSTGLSEGVLDAVGNVGGQSDLCLHADITCTGLLLQLFQQPQSMLAVISCVFVVIDNVQRHQFAVLLGVFHHDGQFEQLRGNLRVFYAKQDLLGEW